MSFSASDVLLAVRDEQPSFTKEMHPDALCCRFLTRYVRGLTNRMAERDIRGVPQTTYQKTVAGFWSTYINLTDHETIIEVVARPLVRNADTDRHNVEILSAQERTHPTTLSPWCYREGNNIIPGGVQAWWENNYDLVYANVVRVHDEIADANSIVDLPTDAVQTCVANLALHLAKRQTSTVDGGKAIPQHFLDSAMLEEERFLERFTKTKDAQTFRIRRVRD